MSSRRNRSKRNVPERRYKKLFILICEGSVTEQDYFRWLEEQYDKAIIRLNVLKQRHSKKSPPALLESAENFKNKDFKKDDELWIVLDKDEWTDSQFNALFEWENKHYRNHVAISCPKFEYWILLHKSDPGHLTPKGSSEKFKQWIGSGKSINTNLLDLEMLNQAVKRAKQKHNPNENIPPGCGSTVYKLVQNIESYLNN